MGGWALAAGLGLADAVLWVCLLLRPAARAPARLERYCGPSPSHTGTATRRYGSPAGRRRSAPRGVLSPRRRRAGLHELSRAFPDALDMLAVCLRAGLGLHAAVAEYAVTASGAAGELFRSYLAELAVGRAPDDALADLARRYPLDEVAAAAAAVAQSLRIGAPLADVFETQAAHCRSLALHRARESAQRLSTQLVLPLIAFIFPVVFIVGLGPVALRVARLVGLIR